MRTQKLPGLSKASRTSTFSLFFLHYDLVYGATETKAAGGVKIAGVNYDLIYSISETRVLRASPAVKVNYCLDYGSPKLMRHLCEAEGR